MEINTLREIVTVASFLAFLAIVVHALRPSNAARFAEAAMVPLWDDEPPPEPSPKGEGPNAGQGFASRGGDR